MAEKNEKLFAKFLADFLIEKDYTMRQLAEEMDISRSAVSHYRLGRRIPDDDTIKKFIKTFKIGKEKSEKIKTLVAMDRTSNFIKPELETITILDEDLIELRVMAIASAGSGYMNFESGNKTVKIRKNGFNDSCYLIEIHGNSMEPLIPDDSYVVVNPNETEIFNGKIYVVELEENIYIKKIFKNEDLQAIILKSLNSDYEDMYITDERLREFKVKGRAVRVIHDFDI